MFPTHVSYSEHTAIPNHKGNLGWTKTTKAKLTETKATWKKNSNILVLYF